MTIFHTKFDNYLVADLSLWGKSNKNSRALYSCMRRDILVGAGAIFSSVGTILLALLILALLIFPVVKNCPNQEECDYSSTAPEPLNYFVTPIFVTADLFVIA